MLHNLVAAEDDQVVMLEDLSCVRIDGCDSLVALVRRAFQQAVHGIQAHLSAVLMLAADLLQTEDVRIQANQLGSQDGYALLKAWILVAPVVQVHEVEGGNAQLDGHSWWEVGEALNLFLLPGMVFSSGAWSASRRPIGLFLAYLQVCLSLSASNASYYHVFFASPRCPYLPLKAAGGPPNPAAAGDTTCEGPPKAVYGSICFSRVTARSQGA